MGIMWQISKAEVFMFFYVISQILSTGVILKRQEVACLIHNCLSFSLSLSLFTVGCSIPTGSSSLWVWVRSPPVHRPHPALTPHQEPSSPDTWHLCVTGNHTLQGKLPISQTPPEGNGHVYHSGNLLMFPLLIGHWGVRWGGVTLYTKLFVSPTTGTKGRTAKWFSDLVIFLIEHQGSRLAECS